MNITVPPIPDGLKPAACWRKTIAGLDVSQPGGAQVIGEWLHAGDVTDVPAGTLVLSVDKRTIRWDTSYRTGERYPVEEVTVNVHLASADELTLLWSRHYKTARSAFGAATIKKITGLLTKHQPPTGELTVITEAKRPNHKAGNCRWCGGHISAGFGHQIGHGEAAQVEHYKKCPERHTPNGAECALCGRTVVAHPGQAVTALVREGEGRWETRHTGVMECTTQPVESWEEYQERRTAERAEAEKVEAKRKRDAERRAGKKAAKQAAERQAHAAEQARIADLTTVSRAERTLNSKGLGGGVRARLVECTDILSDGSTTIRWAVVTGATGPGWTGEDYDPDPGQSTPFTQLEDARHAYRSMQWTPDPRPRARQTSRTDCPGLDVRHCYGCGSLDAPMAASTGPSCFDCYDDLADDHGAHALKYH